MRKRFPVRSRQIVEMNGNVPVRNPESLNPGPVHLDTPPATNPSGAPARCARNDTRVL
jgi:hypothetical protein